jgi:hypothetical protein
MKEVASDVRDRPRVVVLVRLAAEEPGPDDRRLLKSLEDAVEQQHVGQLVVSGSAAGVMNLTVEVENTAEAITKLRAILRSAGALPRSSFKVIAAGGS